MQKIIYEDAPYVILFYDNSLQAVRTDKWTGWKQIPENGPYFFNLTNYNYLNLNQSNQLLHSKQLQKRWCNLANNNYYHYYSGYCNYRKSN